MNGRLRAQRVEHHACQPSGSIARVWRASGSSPRRSNTRPFSPCNKAQAAAHAAGRAYQNLFLKDKKGRLFLVVALSRARIDLKNLHQILGSDRLSFGRPELLLEVLGVPAGSVTPFAR